MTATAKTKRCSPAVSPLIRTPGFEEAAARLEFLVDAGSRVGLLSGLAGIGKTTLLGRFADQLRGEGCLTASINAAGLGPEELIWSIAEKLQTPVEHDWNLFRLWRALQDRLYELRFLREQAVVLVDDADAAGADVLTHLYRLLHVDAAADARLTVVMAVERESTARLGRNLVEMVDLRIELRPWTLTETRALVDAVGRHARPTLFDDAALKQLWQTSRGMPRAILRLAELCRLAVEAEGGNRVDTSIVDGVAAEFALNTAAA